MRQPWLALGIGCVVGAIARDLIRPAQAQNAIRYEYYVAGGPAEATWLTKMGQNGWRLVAATGSGSNAFGYLYLEREIR